MTADTFVLEIADYAAQGCVLFFTFVYPWRVRRGHGFRAFFLPFCVAFVWAIWRISTFDPATSNDIPGIGYLVVPFVSGTMAIFLHGLRCLVTHRDPVHDETNLA